MEETLTHAEEVRIKDVLQDATAVVEMMHKWDKPPESFVLGGMVFCIEAITPELAAKYLEINIPTNRKMSVPLVNGYSRDMTANRWFLNHQGIAFDEDGVLIDGQQRLTAIKKSGKTIQLLVVRGVKRENFPIIDTGRSRSVAHSLAMAGIDGVNKRKLSIARRMLLGMSGQNLSFTRMEQKAIYEKYNRAIEFAYDVCTNEWNVAPVGAVIARAWHNDVIRERLKGFGQVLSTGFMDKGDESAVMLRNYIESSRQESKTDKKQIEMYCKTEMALSHFLQKTQPQRLNCVKEELYLLPGEELDAA